MNFRPLATVMFLCSLLLHGACKGRQQQSGSPVAGASSARSTSKPKTSGPALAVVDLSAGVPEQAPKALLGARRPTFDELMRELQRLETDKKSKGVFVRFGSANLGMARAYELSVALEAVGKTKPVVCHAEAFSNASYLAARGCTQRVVSPPGQLELIGIGAQTIYLRKLLVDKLGVRVDMLQVGKFKGAEEPLTRDGPSDEARASLEGTLADLRSLWLDRMTATGLPAAALLEDGPFTAKVALGHGLVESIAYVDDAKEAAKKQVSAVRDEIRFGPNAVAKPNDLSSVVRILAGDGGKTAPVALLRASGNILMAPSGGPLGGSQAITERELGKVLRQIEQDDAVKAVVLRLDSPGGSALASDLLWHELMRLRAKKPLVVSVGDMAASGGYYMACTGTEILAEPTSILGSIGVVGGKLAFGDALENVGVHAETFSARKTEAAGRRAAYLSPLSNWDEPTRKRVREVMVDIYDMFLDRIVEGRSGKVSREDLATSAEGRIFSGRDAKERKLVDALGGLRDAIVRARQLAGLPDDARVATYGSGGTLLEAINDDGADQEAKAQIVASAFGSQPWWAKMSEEMSPFVAAWLPLAGGESVLTAMPYGLTIR